AAATVIENAGSEAVVLPSLTLIRMFECVPTCADPGVPCSRPVAPSNDAHDGRLAIENVRSSPSGSLAVGAKAYASPTVAAVAGVPEIVGARLPGAAAATVIEKAGREAVALPSLTVMRMFECVPTCPDPGVPCSRPVDVLNVSHDGRFTMLNDSVSPSESLAVGVNAYCTPS